jgi:hypothetical protein
VPQHLPRQQPAARRPRPQRLADGGATTATTPPTSPPSSSAAAGARRRRAARTVGARRLAAEEDRDVTTQSTCGPVEPVGRRERRRLRLVEAAALPPHRPTSPQKGRALSSGRRVGQPTAGLLAAAPPCALQPPNPHARLAGQHEVDAHVAHEEVVHLLAAGGLRGAAAAGAAGAVHGVEGEAAFCRQSSARRSRAPHALLLPYPGLESVAALERPGVDPPEKQAAVLAVELKVAVLAAELRSGLGGHSSLTYQIGKLYPSIRPARAALIDKAKFQCETAKLRRSL